VASSRWQRKSRIARTKDSLDTTHAQQSETERDLSNTSGEDQDLVFDDQDLRMPNERASSSIRDLPSRTQWGIGALAMRQCEEARPDSSGDTWPRARGCSGK
jgi:hypothetical protein